jgi:hypothetical protein
MPRVDPGYDFFEFYSREGASGKPGSYLTYSREVGSVVGRHQMNAVYLGCRNCCVSNYDWSRGIRTWIGVHTSRLRVMSPKYQTARLMNSTKPLTISCLRRSNGVLRPSIKQLRTTVSDVLAVTLSTTIRDTPLSRVGEPTTPKA